eukprot:gene8516-17559_t
MTTTQSSAPQSTSEVMNEIISMDIYNENKANEVQDNISIINNESQARAQEIKDKGNEAFRNGKFEDAILLFSEAIGIYPMDPTFYCNRSMCHASLLNWDGSLLDAKQAVRMDTTYLKAYYRVIKAQIELNQLNDARISFQIAHKMCANLGKDMEILEKALVSLTGIPLRPNISNFELQKELGEGNFSKIYKALYKPSGKVFAIKEIEKATAARMKRRHPNINNEIMMEKQVLYKLHHPNIVPLYCTFQDSSALYYLTEYLDGGELWHAMSIRESSTVKGEGYIRSLIGLPLVLARFYIAELINALEYMH